MTSAPLPDAGSNWVDRHAPEGLKPWLKLGRFDRPIGIWLLLIPGWQGIALALASERRTSSVYDLWLIAGFAIGACLMRAAGCAFNDIVDRDIDLKVARTAARPVASGRISVKKALAFTAACSLVSLLILLTLNAYAILLGFASLGLVAAYPFMKRITWWPQAWLGLTFNWGALMGFTAAIFYAIAATAPQTINGFPHGTEYLVWPSAPYWSLPLTDAVFDYRYVIEPSFAMVAPALALYLGGVFWTLGYDTIYALQDIEDDAMVGVKSSARRLGANVRLGVGVFYLLAIAFAALAGLLAGLGPLFYLGLTGYALHLLWQTRSIRADDGAHALALFKSNREAGLVLLLAIILGSVQLPL
jgi:4-hydroxybenzoate polyprenyltransferase